MKHLKILGSLLIAYALNSCSLTSDASPDTLPPETQNGAETFGCLVNGKVFVPKGNSQHSAIVKIYDGRLVIAATRVGNYSNGIKDQMAIKTTLITGIGTYPCEEEGTLFYTGETCTYGVGEKPINAKINVTKFERGEDKINNLKWLTISGTFEGIILPGKKCSDTIKITQGRFDVKFN